MSRKEHIIQAVQEVLSMNTRSFGRYDIFPRKSLAVEECGAKQLANVLKSIAPGCPSEDILLIVDTTDGKGSRGLVFTQYALYVSKDILHTAGFFSKAVPQPIRYEEFSKMDETIDEYGKTLTLAGQDGRRYVLSCGSYTEFLAQLRKRLNWAMMEIKKEEEAQKKAALARSAGDLLAQGDALAAAGDLPGMVQCLAQAAQTGDGESMYRYAQLFEAGLGVEQDMKTAFQWYEKAVRQDHLDARIKLGEMYLEGRGTERDPYRGKDHYGYAAMKGHPEGQYRHGLQIIQEQGYEDLGLSYLKKAAGQGHAKAAETYQEIKDRQDREFAKAWLYYQSGDYKNAASAFEALARRGMAKAEYQCGYMYWNGEGVPRNPEAAFSYCKRAADSGYTHAMVVCAYLYRSGQGVEEDRSASYAMMQKAAAQGSGEAKLSLQEGGFFDPHIIFNVK